MKDLEEVTRKDSDIKITVDIVEVANNLLEAENKRDNDEQELIAIEWEKSIKSVDKMDYELAICSGIISGIIDSFYVGKFSLDRANEWGSDKVNDFVIKVAKAIGYKGDDLKGAIIYLERNCGLATDTVMDEFGGGLQHHLRDFAHHFSLGGLLFSLFTQFTKLAVGTDKEGRLKVVPLNDEKLIGKDLAQKIFFGIVKWLLHLASDVAGSNKNPGEGAGIPGPVLGLIKKMSMLPFFREIDIDGFPFHKWVSKLYNGTLLAKRDQNGKITESVRFDLRTEIGIVGELGRQMVPVLVNECLVRSMYFVRRTYLEIREKEIKTISDLKKIDPQIILPFNNRAVIRMLTVATGVFSAVDIIDAGIRAFLINGKIDGKFSKDFALRINVVGVGRFVIAVGTDIKKTLEERSMTNDRYDEMASEFEKTVMKLPCLTLNYDQIRLLYSLENIIMEYDIERTKREKTLQYKEKWNKQWKEKIIGSLPLVTAQKETFFYREEEMYHQISKVASAHGKIDWLYLIVMEALLFEPYDESESGTSNKDYLENEFCEKQKLITKSFLESIKKSSSKYTNALTGKNKIKAIGAVGTVAFALATGGVAFTFAPAIAPIIVSTLFGGTTIGLSGAALTSASLAAIGGGALAAGGLGMAGGVAVITGGGTILGLLGGAGLSAANSILLLSEEGYVLSECTKLLIFCKEVLIDKYGDKSAVEDIQDAINNKVEGLEMRLKEWKNINFDDEKNNDMKKEIKRMIKSCEKSIKYLEKCGEELENIIK